MKTVASVDEVTVARVNCSWSGYWPIAMYALYCKLADETQHLIRCLTITLADEN